MIWNLGVLSVIHRVSLASSVYTAQALEAIRSEGKRPAAADIARLSPLGSEHLRFLGDHNFSLPEDLRDGQLRSLRTPGQ